MSRIGSIGKGAVAAGLAGAAALALAWSRRGGEARSTTTAAITVSRPREAVWAAWRRAEHLARLVPPVEIEPIGEDLFRWRLGGAGAVELQGTVQATVARPDASLRMRSPTGSDPELDLEIELADAPADATAVRATLVTRGSVAPAALEALGPVPKGALKEALRRHKRLLELGGAPTTEGQPAGAGRGAR